MRISKFSRANETRNRLISIHKRRASIVIENNWTIYKKRTFANKIPFDNREKAREMVYSVKSIANTIISNEVLDVIMLSACTLKQTQQQRIRHMRLLLLK